MGLITHMAIEEARKRIESFDIFAVPCGNTPLLLKFARERIPEFGFVERFTTTAKRGEAMHLMSLCACAALVASTGAFAGMKATTHHTCYDSLKQDDELIEVVRAAESGGMMRYVVGGLTKKGLRVVSTGGVSWSMDEALYVAELAEITAKMAEYDCPLHKDTCQLVLGRI